MNSNKTTARLAGFLWLLSSITTFFSLGYVRPMLIVSGEATVTAANIVAHEALFRAAIASNLLAHTFLLFSGLMLYHLLKQVHNVLATVLLTSISIAVAVAIVNILNSIGVLHVLGQAEYLQVFSPEQRDAIAMILLRVSSSGQALLEFFWAPYYFAFGVLILKSGFLPRIFGVLLLMMGFGFALNTFTKLLMPQFSPVLFTQLAMFLGALGGVPTTLWLLIKGVSAQQPGNMGQRPNLETRVKAGGRL